MEMWFLSLKDDLTIIGCVGLDWVYCVCLCFKYGIEFKITTWMFVCLEDLEFHITLGCLKWSHFPTISSDMMMVMMMMMMTTMTTMLFLEIETRSMHDLVEMPTQWQSSTTLSVH